MVSSVPRFASSQHLWRAVPQRPVVKQPTGYTALGGRRNLIVEAGQRPPWEIFWQTNERNLSVEWNDDIKQRLLKRATAEKLTISEEEFAEKLEALRQLLPNLIPKMGLMGPDMLAQLVADPAQVAQKLVHLRQIFPQADTSRMVSHRMSLMLNDDLEKVAAAAEELRNVLPTVNVDKLVEDNPEVLNVAAFQKTLQHARDIMGSGFDVIDTLKRSPQRIFQFQQGKDIIPYDEVPTQQPPGLSIG